MSTIREALQAVGRAVVQVAKVRPQHPDAHTGRPFAPAPDMTVYRAQEAQRMMGQIGGLGGGGFGSGGF
ncbi:hypothetical protein P3T37_005927 [Kitasatospora sp. MAA4]|uniref:hypothetical protein n=1 Tax=Kitasatospora sp. MAA4 TaxID=3035093 RepID=UPI002476D8EB|nr:hypothetical protein [Kitasatospora sp. MAA4]MDH6136499.1 hypothetical protein [Kitasatospora sp. MAA4]